jgi:hypothetical protein
VTQAELAAASVETSSPEGTYGAILLIEKEGFTPLFRQVQLGRCFDIGILSTKGTSTAARPLIETLCSGNKGTRLSAPSRKAIPTMATDLPTPRRAGPRYERATEDRDLRAREKI